METDASPSIDPVTVPLAHPYQDDVAFQAWRQLFLTFVKLQRAVKACWLRMTW